MRFSVSKAGLFYSPPIFEMQIYKKSLLSRLEIIGPEKARI